MIADLDVKDAQVHVMRDARDNVKMVASVHV